MMSKRQLDEIEGELEKTVEHLLIARMMDVDLVIIGLENVTRLLAESVAAIREK
ncbi:hypothetical protein [Streptomyces collinus]|uniref:hypothetical protein n=1 Tax=Streptomyces collinus TaxID=42684 RepID=UPI00367D36AA